jgi:hypothetical protein
MAKEPPVELNDLYDPPAEIKEGAPPAPKATGGPPKNWKHRDLYERVLRVLHALPARFRTKLNIAGVSATDLFTLNTALGAAIEVNVVEALNDLRPVWDPSNDYAEYSFVRHAQAFPDVRFGTSVPDSKEPIIFGIELKGWFLLGKEGEPSFRYKISPNACAVADLLVVYPWVLDEVTSGSPELLKPFVAEARHAAEHRNYYWQQGRRVRAGKEPNTTIEFSKHAEPYPSKSDKANDKPASDSGNFGRVARGGFMTSFVSDLMENPIRGIPAKHWQTFLEIFAEGRSAGAIKAKLDNIRKQFEKSQVARDRPDDVEAFLNFLESLLPR